MTRRRRRTEPEVVYFDANGIGNLVPPDDSSLARHRRRALALAVQSGRLRVVVSGVLLQELLAIGDTNWPAYRRIMRFLREVAEPRLLLHTNELAAREFRFGRALRGNERFAEKRLSERPWRAATDRRKVPDITREAKAKADQLLSGARQRRDDVTAKLTAITKPGDSVAAGMRKWLLADPTSRIEEFARVTAASLFGVSEGYPVRSLPAFWHYHAYSAVRIALTHGERAEAIKLGDPLDTHHYVAASYVSIFVSDDAPLARTAAAIPGGPTPLTFLKFAQRYLR